MTIRDPFEGLAIDPAVVCRFFAVFSRFEYVLKVDQRFRQKGRRGQAEPGWWAFGEYAAAQFAAPEGSELGKAIAYLVGQPPQDQKFEGLE